MCKLRDVFLISFSVCMCFALWLLLERFSVLMQTVLCLWINGAVFVGKWRCVSLRMVLFGWWMW